MIWTHVALDICHKIISKQQTMTFQINHNLNVISSETFSKTPNRLSRKKKKMIYLCACANILKRRSKRLLSVHDTRSFFELLTNTKSARNRQFCVIISCFPSILYGFIFVYLYYYCFFLLPFVSYLFSQQELN